jgi:riboflavin synthase
MGTVNRFEEIGESWLLEVMAPLSLAKYLAYKGSITVNGVSLTVNRVEDGPEGCMVSINLIPHTIENTSLGHLKTGSAVNLEIDTVARYVERMISLDISLKANP